MAAAAAVGDDGGEGEGHGLLLGYPNATSCLMPANAATTTTMTHQPGVALLLWGVGVSVAAVEPDHDRVTAAAAGGVVATDASRQKSAAAAAVGPVRTWHQSLLRPTYQPSVDGDGAVDTQILRSLGDWARRG